MRKVRNLGIFYEENTENEFESNNLMKFFIFLWKKSLKKIKKNALVSCVKKNL